MQRHIPQETDLHTDLDSKEPAGCPATEQSMVSFKQLHIHAHAPRLRLLTLPTEILDKIISFTLPDLYDLAYATNLNVDNELITHPLSQVSRALRGQCFEYINHTYIFMSVTIPLSMSKTLPTTGPQRIQCLNPQLYGNMTQNVAKIHMKFSFAPLQTRIKLEPFKETLHTVVSVFNPGNVLHIFNQLTSSAPLESPKRVKTKYENINGHLEGIVRRLFVPCMFNIRGIVLSESQIMDNEGSSAELKDSVHDIASKMTVEQYLTQSSKTIFSLAQLETDGYMEQAGLISLYSGWIWHELKHMPPSTDDWEEDDILHQSLLRNFVYFVENIAFVSWAFLLDKLGQDWCHFHSTRFFHPLCRFSAGVSSMWFGLQPEFRATLHYQSALILTLANDCDKNSASSSCWPYRQGKRCIEAAAVTQISHACLLHPTEPSAKLQTDLIGKLDRETYNKGLDDANKQWWEVRVQPNITIWQGNTGMIGDWPTYLDLFLETVPTSETGNVLAAHGWELLADLRERIAIAHSQLRRLGPTTGAAHAPTFCGTCSPPPNRGTGGAQSSVQSSNGGWITYELVGGSKWQPLP